jgi:hypothetical protein
MININEHVEEINGKKYVPYDIALKAINNIYIDGVERQVTEVETEMNSLIKRLNNIKLDD